jgi:hypothetical protein
MQTQICLLPSAIAELFAQVTYSGKITVADRYGLLAAILDEFLSEEERFSIDRLLRSVHRGALITVDELSTIRTQEFW